jgi:serine/threonine protein kinase
MHDAAPSALGDPFLGQELPSDYHNGVRYRVERRLGEGGTAIAYLATRLAPDGQSPAVIKIILPRIVADSDERALTIIKKEAVALGRLNERLPPTPFVVRLLDTGSVSFLYINKQIALPWIALEYVHGGIEGATLVDRVSYSIRATGFAFDPERAARAISSLAFGLSEIHAVGVVHRDLSPGNVLACGAGDTETFKISDFGIARPMGLAATFGDALVGTPGYVPPEQISTREGFPLGPHTDIFSFAAIVYFFLTGEHYFAITSPAMALAATQAAPRRSLLESSTLAYELRERQAACQAIDLALARATAYDPRERPQSARLFSDSLMPWIDPQPHTVVRPSRRWITSMQRINAPDPAAGNWTVRHPPGDDRLILSVAWNATGHCLAATYGGLCYWDGTAWIDVPVAGLAPGVVSFVERLGPASWLLGGAGATLLEYSRDGLRPLVRGPDPTLTFTRGTTDLDDVAVLVGERPGAPPELWTLIGKRWLRPMIVQQASALTSLARLDDEHWLVGGRGADGRAFAAIYRPLMWQLDRVGTPQGRAVLGCAGRPERALATAVGGDGLVVALDAGKLSVLSLPGAPDLATVAIDALGRQWAAGRGYIWVQRLHGGWELVWQEPRWNAPFVGLLAEIGLVAAVTVDGGVLECRSSALDATTPAG